MERSKLKTKRRSRRHLRLRKKVCGTAQRPRLAVYRSLAHIYGQLIDDEKGVTLLACSSLDKALKGTLGNSSNIKAATAVGEELGRRALQAGIDSVSFDRGGFKYHGRVKALADGARKAGLKF